MTTIRGRSGDGNVVSFGRQQEGNVLHPESYRSGREVLDGLIQSKAVRVLFRHDATVAAFRSVTVYEEVVSTVVQAHTGRAPIVDVCVRSSFEEDALSKGRVVFEILAGVVTGRQRASTLPVRTLRCSVPNRDGIRKVAEHRRGVGVQVLIRQRLAGNRMSAASAGVCGYVELLIAYRSRKILELSIVEELRGRHACTCHIETSPSVRQLSISER